MNTDTTSGFVSSVAPGSMNYSRMMTTFYEEGALERREFKNLSVFRVPYFSQMFTACEHRVGTLSSEDGAVVQVIWIAAPRFKLYMSE